jgi:poly(3-hydroxybutyrate) depolymerase
MRQGNLLFGTLAALFVGVDPSAAEHDDIPDPAPLFVSQRLPTDLSLAPNSVTVSGLSSGGFFAHQFHIAFSGTVGGAAILAGGPYGCVDLIDNPFLPFQKLDRTSAAVVACTNTLGSRFWGLRPEPPTAEDARRLIDAAHEADEIDDPAHLADDRVWLFRGELDDVVSEAVAGSVADLYRLLGVDGAALHVERGDPERPANHGMPVDSFSGESRFIPRDCDEYAPPFLIECGYDAAGLLLQHLYPDGFFWEPVDPHAAGRLQAFNQAEFFEPAPTAGLSEVGYIYAPDACRSEECRLHIAFHGCRQNVDAQGDERIHDDFVRDAGYNRWAAANRIVVVYPQAREAEGNPRACWDFWGYSGEGWRTQEGVQMRAVARIVKDLLDR